MQKAKRDPGEILPGRGPWDELLGKTEGFSGAELEGVVKDALYAAFAAGHDIVPHDLVQAATETIPLSKTAESRIDALRKWAKDRARPAGKPEVLTSAGRWR